ncbi:DinI-like family protein [Klebsiella variicola]|uniref:DinI-like family protein n=1 Tax=Klebsiella variicola TaxID=244366 RepID=UPI002B058501|nr:DinI-like family protein [Klebsiella variicola]
MPGLEKVLSRRVDQNFNRCSLMFRRTGSDELTVPGGMGGDRKRTEETLKDTWEIADELRC